MIRRIAALHDLSGVGRCSLAALLPVFSAMGLSCCPLPTAVYSNQTEYLRFHHRALTGEIPLFARRWQEMGLSFDGISVGFLQDSGQMDAVCDFLDRFHRPGTQLLLDPVLGDDGALYPVFGRPMVAAMRTLVRRADLLTPNLTEACLLCDADYTAMQRASDRELQQLLRQLSSEGPRTVVLTGIRRENRLVTFCYLAEEDRLLSVENERIGGHYSGTGDLFAAVLLGGWVLGLPPERTLRGAAQFLEAAIRETAASGTDPREGVLFERHLDLLIALGREADR